MIRPVIVSVPSQAASVHQLVQWIKNLDGTEVKVVQLTKEDDAAFVPEYPKNEKACRAAFSLHKAALAMKGEPFIWLEHDAVPLKAGWAQSLSDEYERLQKPFMLSSDSNAPFDLIGGIGVYGPATHWMIPQHYRHAGWDLWMLKNIQSLISRTPLIQHSYGIYDPKGNVSLHMFPRDVPMLREDAVIFHRDVQHTLFNPRAPVVRNKVFYHSGDLGDIIYALPVIQRMGGGRLVLGPQLGFDPGHTTRESMTKERCDVIAPLLCAQPYISSTKYTDDPPEGTWINLNRFRSNFNNSSGRTCSSLQRLVLRTFNLAVQDEVTPWLVPALGQLKDRHEIIINRSERYHNDAFPWTEIVKSYGSKACFVGIESEWELFSKQFGAVEYVHPATLLGVYYRISNARLFIGNQSCPYAIAEGLKKPCVQETWPVHPNCQFQRPNVLNMTTDTKTICSFIEGYL